MTYQVEGSAHDSSFAAAKMERELPPVGGGAKRIFDVMFSTVAMLGTLPFYIVLPILIYVISPGPVFYSHKRIGFRGKTFSCFKFRTMRLDADRVLQEHLASNPEARAEFKLHRKLKKDPRVIPLIGLFLRRSSIDEFPQFLNVFRGEMSIVGPRPLTLEELNDYGEAAGRYKSARPGITGLWQVSGRSDVSFSKRVELDTSYVANCTLLTDLWLIAKTIGVLVNGRGAY